MQTTISLGRDMAVYANDITNVFTTKDYIGDLRDEYRRHVRDFYSPTGDNLFTNVYVMKKVLERDEFSPEPCVTPLSDIESVKDELLYIVDNPNAYVYVIDSVMAFCKNTNSAGQLMYDLLSVLKSSNEDFRDTALKYDRYMGDVFSVAKVIRAVYSYGKLTGLVDFANMDELLPST